MGKRLPASIIVLEVRKEVKIVDVPFLPFHRRVGINICEYEMELSEYTNNYIMSNIMMVTMFPPNKDNMS